MKILAKLGFASALVIFSLLGLGCAGRVPIAAGAEKIQVQHAPPQGSAVRLKELRASHGSGCGAFGSQGDKEGAMAMLRNQALETGADYVQITRIVEPYTDDSCRHNEYVVEGIAFRMQGDGSLQIAGSGPKTGNGAPPPTRILSSCPGQAPVEANRAVRMASGSCAYRMSAQPPGAEYSVTFSARLESGASYAVWPVGTWNGGSIVGTGIVYDVERGKVRVVGYGKPAGNTLPALERALDREFHTWRVVRLRDRVVVWLDGQLLIVLSAEPGGEWGFRTEQGVLDVCEVETRPLSPEEGTEVRAHRVVGWYGAGTPTSGTSGVMLAAKPRPAATRPPRMVGACDIDAINWTNREYPGSGVSKGKSFTLADGKHQLTSKKMAPDPITGATEAGTMLAFAGVVPADLGGEALNEVVVSVSYVSYGGWTGNRPSPPQPESRYAYRLSETCEPELLGFADYKAGDHLRFADGAMLRIYGSGDNYTVEEWRVTRGKLTLSSTHKAGREALDDPLKPCDEEASLAGLRAFVGRNGGDLAYRDPCITRKLRKRLGKKRAQFEQYTSMGLSTLKERDGHLVASGCMSHYCGFRMGSFSVHLKTGVVEALIVDLDKEQRISRLEWLTENGAPLAPLREPIDEAVARSKALWE